MAESPFDNVEFPPYNALPFKKGDPEGNYDYHYYGSTTIDELGALNLLTQRRILRASQAQIQVGKVCSLNWAMHKPSPNPLGRQAIKHKVARYSDSKFIIDDEVSMNTQIGTQWDGFRHFGHASGKIVGRGILLDYYSYAVQNGLPYSPVESHLVTAQDLDACVKAQNLSLEVGDILFIRMGYINWYEQASEEERTKTLQTIPGRYVGIRQGMDEVRWFWDHHFAAVAADTPSFEARPTVQNWDLHEYLLSLWGTPIGELFDLEELAKTCKSLNRYSFFVTSSPLHLVNGIASPANALAIF
ncbi:hypothetical protein AGABI1DRAFT_123433 [Agaricus bisporus var. burnettii JB137-S8]|uniref:Cyclase n=1 Tax=Agaricus bisporus var. burnettii (strain JB137-S8 / ATCC MYA-4627 / FGSC 10392) TaxID=597362 RepID=K5WI36_AGABU|nr:uncharacterized protein AGABI1DRAFT_123433 [Agaricus bisporus var. burnettii JB137-S8]EKM74941.1 hypothetical protein AGABI1DRAFT_123433 [Agaricus bisporus var. burnettii JB137-S8]